jgi:hypothetical protein
MRILLRQQRGKSSQGTGSEEWHSLHDRARGC